MNITMQAVFLMALWCITSAAGAANHGFEHGGASARHVTLDTSTGEPRPTSAELIVKLAEYRAQFHNAKTAQEMADFIAKYQGKDPEKLVPRAKIRAHTFAAFEAASSAHQCAEAKKLHQKITGYKVTLPFSYPDCERERIALDNKKHDADPQELYVAGVRLEDGGERERARAQFRSLLERYPQHPLALKAADRLARLAEIEWLEAARGGSNTSTHAAPSPAPAIAPILATTIPAACPKDLGYIRSRMVFAELRDNPNFAEPIEGIIRKAGGLDAAISEVERLIQGNQRSLYRAAGTLLQTPAADLGEGRNYRCEKPEGDWCSANYYYHLLRESQFYYAELLNSLRCQKTGQMQNAAYTPASLQRSSVFKSAPGGPLGKPPAETRP